MVKKKIRLIACDLDETLYTTDRKISKENVQAIQKAKEAGVIFVPATGRGYTTVDPTLTDLGLLNQAGQYVISFNGSAITENKDNRLLYFETLDFQKADTLYQRGLQYDVMIQVYTKDKIYGYHFPEEEKVYLAGRMEIIETSELNLDFLDEPVVKVIYMNTSYDYLHSIHLQLGSLTEDLEVSYSSNRYLEFNSKGICKGRGLQKLCELLNIPLEETMAIGDNFNDLSMIQAAGMGVGVANSIEGIKPYCDYITEATNDESAIAEVINKFVL